MYKVIKIISWEFPKNLHRQNENLLYNINIFLLKVSNEV